MALAKWLDQYLHKRLELTSFLANAFARLLYNTGDIFSKLAKAKNQL